MKCAKCMSDYNDIQRFCCEHNLQLIPSEDISILKKISETSEKS